MAKKDDVAAYIQALKQEIQLVIPHLDKSRKISQIHYGGGTPNGIAVEYLHEINQLFFDNFTFVNHAEIAIECHPAYLDVPYLQGLQQAGFNRYSLGIQDLNTDVLKAVNRTPSKLPLDELTAVIRGNEKATVNFDFIYGLPLQTKESFLDTIEKAIALKPNRLVTFSYAHVPWVNKAQEILEKIGLPSSAEKINMTEGAFNLLEQNGYKSIGMDHYVLEEDELYKAQESGNLHRNFQGYCTRETTGQVYAFGVSAISQLDRVFAQNTKSIPDYIANINDGNMPVIKGYELSDKESIIGKVISQFMCNKSLEWSELSKQIGFSVQEIQNSIILDNSLLSHFMDDGIIQFDDKKISITNNGLPFIRNVVASFDPLLKHSQKTFSKSV